MICFKSNHDDKIKSKKLFDTSFMTEVPVFGYRNQSSYLRLRSVDWSLIDRDLCRIRVKKIKKILGQLLKRLGQLSLHLPYLL